MNEKLKSWNYQITNDWTIWNLIALKVHEQQFLLPCTRLKRDWCVFDRWWSFPSLFLLSTKSCGWSAESYCINDFYLISHEFMWTTVERKHHRRSVVMTDSQPIQKVNLITQPNLCKKEVFLTMKFSCRKSLHCYQRRQRNFSEEVKSVLRYGLLSNHASWVENLK